MFVGILSILLLTTLASVLLTVRYLQQTTNVKNSTTPDWAAVWTMNWTGVSAAFTALSSIGIVVAAVYAAVTLSASHRSERLTKTLGLIDKFDNIENSLSAIEEVGPGNLTARRATIETRYDRDPELRRNTGIILDRLGYAATAMKRSYVDADLFLERHSLTVVVMCFLFRNKMNDIQQHKGTNFANVRRLGLNALKHYSSHETREPWPFMRVFFKEMQSDLDHPPEPFWKDSHFVGTEMRTRFDRIETSLDQHDQRIAALEAKAPDFKTTDGRLDLAERGEPGSNY